MKKQPITNDMNGANNISPSALEQIKHLTTKIISSAAEEGIAIEIDDMGIQDINDEDDEINDARRATEKIKVNNHTISVVEFAILNSFFYSCHLNELSGIKTESYGQVDPQTNALYYGGSFSHVNPWWFKVTIDGFESDLLVQTIMFKDNWGQMMYRLSLSVSDGMTYNDYKILFNSLKKIAFNYSEYKGKCIKVKVIEGCFKGIEILDSTDFNKELILTDTQKKFIKHYVNRLKRGSVVRYLFNGEPGTGKTESIRNIMFELLPDVTFVIPEFEDVRDLVEILEACEIFDPSVIVLDDIDLYLGSRDRGNYTRLLGQFLSFFDGVKKRKVSLLASTNDKGLVDRAAERPGRFNLILDFGYLEKGQIEAVVKMYLPEKYHTDKILNAFKRDKSGKEMKITGAFIGNVGENIQEMELDEPDWTDEDTICIIHETYAGFYASQVSKKTSIKFTNNED